MSQRDTKLEFHAIDAALEEEVGGATPPDLWEQIEHRADRVSTNPRSQFWRAAILLVAGAAVVAATVWSTRSAADLEQDQPTIGLIDGNGPRDFGEFQAWLDAEPTADVAVRAFGIRYGDGEFALVWRHPLESLRNLLFRGRDTVSITGDGRLAEIVQELRRGLPATTDADIQRPEHVLSLSRGEHKIQIGIVGCGKFPSANPDTVSLQCAILGKHGPIRIELTPRFAQLLDIERMIESTENTVTDNAIALGDEGLRSLATDTTRLRCVGITPAALPDLLRFEKLQRLELVESPELHATSSLQMLAKLGVKSLVVDGHHLSRDAAITLGEFTTLEELSVFDLFSTLAQMESPGGYVIPSSGRVIDDEVLESWGRLTELRELHIHGAAVTDDGLGYAARFSQLRELGLLGCESIRGHGLAHVRVERIQLSITKNFDPRALARMDGLRKVVLDGSIDSRDLATIASNPTLDAVNLGHSTIAGASAAMWGDVLSGRKIRFAFFRCPDITTELCDEWERQAPDCTFKLDR